jgi:hypothetical protein
MAVALALVAAAAAIEAYFVGPATGRLLLTCAAVVLGAIASVDLVFSPRLTATSTGLAVFAPNQRLRLRWAEIDSVRVDERSHRGLATRALEIESGDLLIVLSKRSLGRDPRDVATELGRLRLG